jgi:hypothetical protein
MSKKLKAVEIVQNSEVPPQPEASWKRKSPARPLSEAGL